MHELLVQPGGVITGAIQVPGDKSISHRSIMLASIANGVSQIHNFLEGEDCLATLKAFQAMGVQIEHPQSGELIIHGVGKHGLRGPEQALDLGNSGTSMRLLVGLLAGAGIDAVLTGDESLQSRPMARVVKPLLAMGANIETRENNLAPLTISANAKLQGIKYAMPIASAQVKSCLLLAGMYAAGETIVSEPGATRDHTERMLTSFDYPFDITDDGIKISNQGELQAIDLDVPGDISSAAFFMVAASIAPNSNLRINNVGINPTRDGVINILRAMGANIAIENKRMLGGEPVADLVVTSAELSGIEIPQDQIPLAIDEFPSIFIACACANGTSVLRGAKELRVKESDRIKSMALGLTSLGIEVEELEDGIVIQGGEIQSGCVDSFGDHRIAMSFAIAGLRASGEIRILNAENIATSFPEFVGLARVVGLGIG